MSTRRGFGEQPLTSKMKMSNPVLRAESATGSPMFASPKESASLMLNPESSSAGLRPVRPLNEGSSRWRQRPTVFRRQGGAPLHRESSVIWLKINRRGGIFGKRSILRGPMEERDACYSDLAPVL